MLPQAREEIEGQYMHQLGFLIITEDKSVVFKITNEHFLNPFADCSILT